MKKTPFIIAGFGLGMAAGSAMASSLPVIGVGLFIAALALSYHGFGK